MELEQLEQDIAALEKAREDYQTRIKETEPGIDRYGLIQKQQLVNDKLTTAIKKRREHLGEAEPGDRTALVKAATTKAHIK